MATIVAARVQAKASRFGDASVICLATVVSVLSPMRNMSGAAWRAAGSIWHESRTSRALDGAWLEGSWLEGGVLALVGLKKRIF